jgi:tetratricopeptide (TPR) repeat protein
VETSATIAPNLLPVISQAIKEALMQELAMQRRELLSAQQTAAAELASLARRLEAIQTPLLERLGGLRPSALTAAQFHREIPVKIYCVCGQKYSFEVQPVAGRVPFPVACPACGQDGTHQANQVIARTLNGITQSLPSPGRPAWLNSTPSGLTPRLVDAVKQAVVKELAGTRAEAPNTVPMADIRKDQNGSVSPENHVGNFVTNLLLEGQSLADTSELDKAVKCFEAALVLQPDRAEALVKMGGVLDKLDRAEEALQYYDRAIALDESLTIAYLNKGGLCNRLARYDEALRCYEQALHKQKKSAA